MYDTRVYIKDIHDLSLVIGYQENRLTSITDAQGKVTKLHYKESGLVEKITDPFGRTTLLEYDDKRNLISLIDMGGFQTKVEYRDDSTIKALINRGGRTEFLIERSTTEKDTRPTDQYPLPGQEMKTSSRITVTHPDNSKEEFYYNGFNTTSWYVTPENYRLPIDAIGRITTFQLEKGEARSHFYDTMDRLEKIQVGDLEYRYEYQDEKSPLISKLIHP